MKWKEYQINLPDGTPIRVRERGEQDQPTLIWTHGQFFPMDVEEITPVEGILADLVGWRVIRYDGRGHGASGPGTHAAQHRWSSLGADILAVADQLAVTRFVAAGASMGAAASVHATLIAPQRVSGLVLSVPPTAWASRLAQVANYHHMLKALASGGARAVAEILRADIEGGPADPYYDSAFGLLVDAAQQMDPSALRLILEGAASSDLPSPALLATLEAPTLLLPVTGDPGHPMSTAEALAAALPYVTLHPLESMTPAAGTPIRAFLERIQQSPKNGTN